VWALGRLVSREKFSALAQRKTDNDTSVNDEWIAALG